MQRRRERDEQREREKSLSMNSWRPSAWAYLRDRIDWLPTTYVYPVYFHVRVRVQRFEIPISGNKRKEKYPPTRLPARHPPAGLSSHGFPLHSAQPETSDSRNRYLLLLYNR